MNNKKIDKYMTTLSWRERIGKWASQDFFVPLFFYGLGCSSELISHLSLEISKEDVYLFDRNATSLSPNLLVISGIINHKQMAKIKTMYNDLTGTKYVVVIGSQTRNPFQLNSYNIVTSIEDYIPVDLYIEGNPPTRQEIRKGLNRLREIRI